MILSTNVFAQQVYSEEQEDKFIQAYALRYKLPPDYIKQVLSQAVFQPASYQIQQPRQVTGAKTKSWIKYRSQFLNSKMIRAGQKFMCQHQKALAHAQASYDVPPAIILGIIGVETSYGGYTGKYRVLDTLATLAFNSPRRIDFFQDELAQYILMCHQYNLDPTEMRGAVDGGFGLSQFMPSSYLKFAVSDNNTTPNLYLANDAIMSVANYIAEHGWQSDQPVVLNVKRSHNTCKTLACNQKATTYPVKTWQQNGVQIATSIQSDAMADLVFLQPGYSNDALLALDNFFVIYSYNHSYKYTMAVYLLGNAVVKQVKQSGC